MATARSVMFLLFVSACGGDGTPSDASPDVDNGTCGAMIRFTGDYLDWDSGSASFCGVFGAGLAVPGGETKTTPPNGRVDLCVPDQAVTLIAITPPAAASQCTRPSGSYALPGIAVANKAVIEAGGAWRGRAFVTTRQAIDPAKAQVLVHVVGTPRDVQLAAAHGAAQARANDTWAAGSSGEDVFFPDVDPGAGTTTLTAGTAIGTGSIPLVAGKLTNVTIVAN